MAKHLLLSAAAVFWLSCAAVQHLPHPEPPKPPNPAADVCGVLISAPDWHLQEAELARQRLYEIIDRCGRGGFNVLVLELPCSAASSVDLSACLQQPVQEAHRIGLSVFAGLDLQASAANAPGQAGGHPIDASRHLNADWPELSSRNKSELKKWLQAVEWDGLFLDCTDHAASGRGGDALNRRQPRTDEACSGRTFAEVDGDYLLARAHDLIAASLVIRPDLMLFGQLPGSNFAANAKTNPPSLQSSYTRQERQTLFDALVFSADDLARQTYSDTIQAIGFLELADFSPSLDQSRATAKEPGHPHGRLLRIDANASEWSATEPAPGAAPLPYRPLRLRRSGRAERAVVLQWLQADGTPRRGQIVQINGFCQIADADGWAGVVLPGTVDSLQLISGNDRLRLKRDYRWRLPFRYRITEEGQIERPEPFIELRDSPGDSVRHERIPVLFRASFPAEAAINGIACKQYQTGIFFHEITLQPGINRVTGCCTFADSAKEMYEKQIFLLPPAPPRPPLPLWIDTLSIEPKLSRVLLPEDRIAFSLIGSQGQTGWLEIRPAGQRFPLQRQDESDFSRYSIELPAAALPQNTDMDAVVHLQAATGPQQAEISAVVPGIVRIQTADYFPLLRTTAAKTALTYNLGMIRLGGPILAEYGSGVILQSDGRFGKFYRVRLGKSLSAFLSAQNVEALPNGSEKPFTFIRSIQAAPGQDEDVVVIPYEKPIPYAIFPEPEQKRLVVRLFGAQTLSTWLTHRQNLRLVDRITWEQSDPETYTIYVNLKTDKIWGYTIEAAEGFLRLRLRYPPRLDKNGQGLSPAGLKVAIEAGHGGSNLGAIGLSGLEEKTINLEVAQELGKICREHGIQVIQIRQHDVDMGLQEKQDTAVAEEADLLISIHANAAGTGRGYLGASGTSTYYHNPFWAPLAHAIYDRLLELPLAEFGVVGSFNYLVTRLSTCPAVLVEQAFMSHAEDEEKLNSADFRRNLAHKIFLGLIDYLSEMTGQPIHSTAIPSEH